MRPTYVVDSLSLLNRPQILEKVEGFFYVHVVSLKFLEHLKDGEDGNLSSYKSKAENALKIIKSQEGKRVTIFGEIPSKERLKEFLEDKSRFFKVEVELILKEVFQLKSSGRKVILFTSLSDLVVEAQKNGIEVKRPDVFLLEKNFKLAAEKLKPVVLTSACLLIFGVISFFWFFVIAGLYLWFKLGSYFLNSLYQVLSCLNRFEVQFDSSYSHSLSSSWNEEAYLASHSYYDDFETRSSTWDDDYFYSSTVSRMDGDTLTTIENDWSSDSFDKWFVIIEND